MLSLSEILQTKLLPWSQQDASEHFIIARPKMYQSQMPYGVQLIPHKIPTGRVIIKDRRNYNNVRNIIAKWPDAGLYELGKYVLVCVLEGYVDYTLGNYRVLCGPGHFIFIPPGVPQSNGPHTYVDMESSDSCGCMTFLLHPDALECSNTHVDAQKWVQNNSLILHGHVVSLLQVLMEEMFDTSEKYGILPIAEKLLNPFFEVLLREVEAERFQPLQSTVQALWRLSPPSRRPRFQPASPADFLTHLEQYIQANLHKPLTLADVSAAMYFSSRQFARTIRCETGKSFHEYLAEQRIAKAKELLLNTAFTVTAIASMVGISSHRYFRTFSKHHTGLTPTAFRSTASKIKN